VRKLQKMKQLLNSLGAKVLKICVRCTPPTRARIYIILKVQCLRGGNQYGVYQNLGVRAELQLFPWQQSHIIC